MASVGRSMRCFGPVRSPSQAMASKKPGFVTNQRRGGVAVRSTSPQADMAEASVSKRISAVLRILSPAPEPNGPGVARGRGHAVPKGAGEEERIRVEPVDAALGFGQNEPLGRGRLSVSTSNSRSTTASLPPRESRRMARRRAVGSIDPPAQIQSSSSSRAKASRSSSTCQSGFGFAIGGERRVSPDVRADGRHPARKL